jgi:hypothetical protein
VHYWAAVLAAVPAAKSAIERDRWHEYFSSDEDGALFSSRSRRDPAGEDGGASNPRCNAHRQTSNNKLKERLSGMLYHYTSARLLEKIIASGKLLPAHAPGGRLLWATSAQTIELISRYHYEPVVARFTLHSCDFEPWTDVRSRFQQEEMREEAEWMVQDAPKFGSHHTNWYVRFSPLPADRWLRIDIRDQRWHPYKSKTVRQRGLRPQLGRMPWYSEEFYEHRGIKLGEDPRTMDDEGLADHHYATMDEDALAELRYRYKKED